MKRRSELIELEREMKIIDELLREAIPRGSPETLYDAGRYLLTARGKRIRPILTILSYKAVGEEKKKIEEVLPIAMALELIHTATIIHDDIIDKSPMRRGLPTVNYKWGEDVAIIAGDLLFSKAFGIIGSHPIRELSKIVSKACIELAEGEILESLHTSDTEMTEEVYLEIIERKTASLFEACTRCGAIVGKGSEEEIEALSKFGFLIGIGFQMTDDALDIAGELKLGKPIGIDICLGKPTFVILHAIKEAKGKDKETLKRIIQDRSCSSHDIKTALKIIKSTNSLKYASERAKYFIKKAKDNLKVLRESDAKKKLEFIADYVISREF
ncbi:MAG: polyprenyl synthetase family protein [Candidatus Hydrothermarchaeota archaeon]|nr:MAG: polyprenyl synthetase family protein [Candidatus Hydrothermarchaeota archaeon]